MYIFSKIDNKLKIKNSNPPNTMYGVPIPDINNPPTAVPIVIPKLPHDRNNPLAKSRASGIADVIQYWQIICPIAKNIPHIIIVMIIDTVNFPVRNDSR